MTSCDPPVLAQKPPRIEELTPQQKAACVEALEALKKKKSKPERIDREFHSLAINKIPERILVERLKVGKQSNNEDKNRCKDVLPFDDTRVMLQSTKGSGSDYMNASYIQGPGNKLPRFIVTQGPLQSTMIDFWEMVMQQRCSVIVMLTALSDRNLEKCAPYFPEKLSHSAVYGRLRVTNKRVCYSRYGIAKRLFEVQAVEQAYEPPLNVLHLEYPRWPDHGVPPSTRSVRELFKCLSSLPHDIPHDTFIVHSSAGIGRCGAYILIDHTVRRILIGDMSAVDIQATVENFRDQRNGMVQTKVQYHFCYTAIIDELEDLLQAVELDTTTVSETCS